jgi:hypothetical protein
LRTAITGSEAGRQPQPCRLERQARRRSADIARQPSNQHNCFVRDADETEQISLFSAILHFLDEGSDHSASNECDVCANCAFHGAQRQPIQFYAPPHPFDEARSLFARKSTDSSGRKLPEPFEPRPLRRDRSKPRRMHGFLYQVGRVVIGQCRRHGPNYQRLGRTSCLLWPGDKS